MGEPRYAQVDWRQVDWNALRSKLTACALRWFRAEGCHEADSVLPGTASSAIDLACDVVAHVLAREDADRLTAPGGDPFAFLLTAMRHDFLDLVKQGREYKRTIIFDEGGEQGGRYESVASSRQPDAFAHADAAVLVRKIHLLLGDDVELKEYVTAWLLNNLDKRADMAYHLGVSEQEVTNRKRRLIYKLKPYARTLTGSRAGEKCYG